jgi:hypothetical protein
LEAPITTEGAWKAAYGSVEGYKAISEATFTYDIAGITAGPNAAKGAWDAATQAAKDYGSAAGAIVIPTPPVVAPPKPSSGGFGFSLPGYLKEQIPLEFMATGGIVTSPTLALIGEAGSEAVIPLSKMGSMGGQNITINVGGSVISEGDLVAAIRDQLLGLQQSGSTITRTNLSI